MNAPLVLVTVAGATAALAALRGPRWRSRWPGEVARRAPRRAPAPGWVRDGLALAGVAVDPDRTWAAATAAVVVTVGALVTMGAPALGLVVAAGALVAPRVLAPAVARRRDRRRDEQLATALDGLAADLRAGRALAPAVVDAAARTPDPLRADLAPLAAEVRHGGALAPALRGWASRPGASPDVVLVATALRIGAQAGGPVARSVDAVAATLRERRELRAEARALATQARASAAVLAVSPIGFTVLVAGVEPGAVRFLTADPIGLACLAAGLALETAGALWMSRILRSAA